MPQATPDPKKQSYSSSWISLKTEIRSHIDKLGGNFYFDTPTEDKLSAEVNLLKAAYNTLVVYPLDNRESYENNVAALGQAKLESFSHIDSFEKSKTMELVSQTEHYLGTIHQMYLKQEMKMSRSSSSNSSQGLSSPENSSRSSTP